MTPGTLLASPICDSARRARSIVFVMIGLVAGRGAFAEADAAKKQAQALQVEGLRLLEKGDNRAALEKFDDAFRLVPSPKNSVQPRQGPYGPR